MTDETPKVEGFDLDDHIACLNWSDEATDYEKTLVIGNLRTLYHAIATESALTEVRAALRQCEAGEISYGTAIDRIEVAMRPERYRSDPLPEGHNDR